MLDVMRAASISPQRNPAPSVINPLFASQDLWPRKWTGTYDPIVETLTPPRGRLIKTTDPSLDSRTAGNQPAMSGPTDTLMVSAAAPSKDLHAAMAASKASAPGPVDGARVEELTADGAISSAAPASALAGNAKPESQDDLRSNLRPVFNKFDIDGSGSISTEELGRACKEIGLSLSPAHLDQMMKDADPNGNGTVDYEEFQIVLKKQMGSGGRFAQMVAGFLNPLSWFTTTSSSSRDVSSVTV